MNGKKDIFVHDRLTGVTTRVSVDSDGYEASGDDSTAAGPSPVLSADGRYVAFHSDASNLVIGDTNKTRDVFMHDRGVTSLVFQVLPPDAQSRK